MKKRVKRGGKRGKGSAWAGEAIGVSTPLSAAKTQIGPEIANCGNGGGDSRANGKKKRERTASGSKKQSDLKVEGFSRNRQN